MICFTYKAISLTSFRDNFLRESETSEILVIGESVFYSQRSI